MKIDMSTECGSRGMQPGAGHPARRLASGRYTLRLVGI
jgi:hypothetical protein